MGWKNVLYEIGALAVLAAVIFGIWKLIALGGDLIASFLKGIT